MQVCQRVGDFERNSPKGIFAPNGVQQHEDVVGKPADEEKGDNGGHQADGAVTTLPTPFAKLAKQNRVSRGDDDKRQEEPAEEPAHSQGQFGRGFETLVIDATGGTVSDFDSTDHQVRDTEEQSQGPRSNAH